MFFVAVHESGYGPLAPFAALRRFCPVTEALTPARPSVLAAWVGISVEVWQHRLQNGGGGIGYLPATNSERARGRLHLRLGRARLRADLQSNRAGQFRPGRPADA